MSTQPTQAPSELESRRLAEASREREWRAPSFLKELFLGRFRFELIHPYPQASTPERPEFSQFFERFRRFVEEQVDPVAIDLSGDYPEHVVEGFRQLGAFGMKIPAEYGGLGFSQEEYNRVMLYLGSVEPSLSALLSAHQSIGVPQPIKLFGSEEQKRRFLPRCAAGAISAFALTEPQVGSDPASLATTAEPSEDGEHYLINGDKLWCTNGGLAELLVVMARTPGGRISAFVVERASPGVEVVGRSRFMGMRAISNVQLRFSDVRVPRANLIGREGMGLKIALVTLNTGRLTIPAVCLGGSKSWLEMSRKWAAGRVQWGHPVGEHEALALRLGRMAARVFAMESMVRLAERLADRGGYDIRLEAAAAKEWGSTRAWWTIDDTMQIRGGRGYETEQSLRERGDVPLAVERGMRDTRINSIFEGSSEIMHLFMAREAVDRHLQVAGELTEPDASTGQKLRALLRGALFYAWWYPSRWLGWAAWPRYAGCGRLARHVRFIDRRAHKLARATFHGMLRFGPGLQYRQGYLFRLVDVGLELFAMAATVSRALALEREGAAEAAEASELADLYCRHARRDVDRWFGELWRNDDRRTVATARRLLAGDYAWLERGARPLGLSEEQLLPWLERELEAAQTGVGAGTPR